MDILDVSRHSSDKGRASSVIRVAGLLLALTLFVLVTGVARGQPPEPASPLQALSWTEQPADIDPIKIVERKQDIRRLRASLQSLPAQQDPFAAIDACVGQEMEQKEVPGAQIAIMQDGELAYERGYGVKHREEGGDIDSDTLFRVGSVTKMMTAAAVMQQVDAGNVELDAPVTDYVPHLEIAGPWPASSTTVDNLLTHTTGYPDLLNALNIDGPKNPAALSRWAVSQSETLLYADPASFWNYSNPNFSLAGLVVEEASDMFYHEYMEQQVWATAGMTRTMLLPADAIAYGNYTHGHYANVLTGEPMIVAPDAYDNVWAAPAANAFSTASDLVKWAQILMTDGGDVLSPQSAAAMQDDQVWIHITPDLFYGYGIMAEGFWGVDTRHHGGNVPGWGAYLLWVPEENFAVSVLGNTTQSMTSSTYCATAVMLGLAPPAEQPDYSTDPDTWDQYVGQYDMLQYSVSIPSGEPFPVFYPAVVSKEEDELTITFPGQPDPMDPTQTFSRPLTQLVLDTFAFDVNHDGQVDLDVTFIEDPESGEVKWLRNRQFVGAEADMPAGNTNLTARSYVDYRCDGFFQEGLDLPVRNTAVTLSFTNGARVTVPSRSLGLTNIAGFDTSGGVALSLQRPTEYQGYQLEPCPGDRARHSRLTPADFRSGYRFLQFRANVAGEAAGP